jgi:hypothetical protein
MSAAISTLSTLPTTTNRFDVDWSKLSEHTGTLYNAVLPRMKAISTQVIRERDIVETKASEFHTAKIVTDELILNVSEAVGALFKALNNSSFVEASSILTEAQKTYQHHDKCMSGDALEVLLRTNKAAGEAIQALKAQLGTFEAQCQAKQIFVDAHKDKFDKILEEGLRKQKTLMDELEAARKRLHPELAEKSAEPTVVEKGAETAPGYIARFLSKFTGGVPAAPAATVAAASKDASSDTEESTATPANAVTAPAPTPIGGSGAAAPLPV